MADLHHDTRGTARLDDASDGPETAPGAPGPPHTGLDGWPPDSQGSLAARYQATRASTEAIAAPLSAEDQSVQAMPDASPTKWHRGHTTWFFETFVLLAGEVCPKPFHPAFGYLFNSYYETVGPRHPRAGRGLVSRPGIDEIAAYRRHVDGAMGDLLSAPVPPGVSDMVELGMHHEQQHQELILMDIKNALWRNPLHPPYTSSPQDDPDSPPLGGGGAHSPAGWTAHPGGEAAIGHEGTGFSFDNERPRHLVRLVPFSMADRPVTAGEWEAFIDDAGYDRPELWLSEGWSTACAEGWRAPLYWHREGECLADAERARTGGAGSGEWVVYTLGGDRPVHPSEPVCHVSYYEADAFARWAGARLPTEAEWEASAQRGSGARGPGSPLGTAGEVWEWTSSAYSPYPGFSPAPGAVGEYNGKFMVNQYVLRGGSRATPRGHCRPTYRNFFPAHARWAFSGLRLALDGGR